VIPSPRPNRDDEADYRAFAARRRPDTRDLLLQAARRVNAAYVAYRSSFADCELHVVDPTLGDALRSNFALMNRGKPFEFIRDELLAAAGGLCPLCARGSAASLDHYLPQKQYPEFSVLVLNLVPCCERCNRLKGDLVKRVDGARFLHAYFDELPDEEILIANVDTDPSVFVSFSIKLTPALTLEQYNNLEYHFSTLQLDSYYRKEANTELFDRLEAAEEYYSFDGAQGVRKYLDREYRSARASRGPNYWRAALFAGLSRSVEFCEGAFKRLTA
jgi:hypothetical protein